MLAEYTTISTANNLAFHKVNVPDFSMILSGFVMSLVGILSGMAVRYLKEKKKI